jgi:hypothetical protein
MNTLPEWEQDKTQKATEGLLPFKSQDKYEKEYETFRIWQSKYEIATVSATVLLAYFQELVSFTVKLFLILCLVWKIHSFIAMDEIFTFEINFFESVMNSL